jgi:hypothetical protein
MSQTNYVPAIGTLPVNTAPNIFFGDAYTAGVNTQLSSVPVYFRTAEIYPYKDVSETAAPTPNVGDVYIGWPDIVGNKFVTDQLAAGGGPLVIQAPPGQVYSLSDIYVLADTTDDNVYVRYSL